MFAAARQAVEDFETIANVIDWAALDEWRAQQAAITAAMFCPSYERIAAMTAPAAPPQFEFSVPEPFYSAMALTPAFEDEPDFEVKPKRRIGF